MQVLLLTDSTYTSIFTLIGENVIYWLRTPALTGTSDNAWIFYPDGEELKNRFSFYVGLTQLSII